MQNDITKITACDNAIFHPPNKNPEIIAGHVHGTTTPLNGGTSPLPTTKYISIPTTVGVNTNGAKRNGFITIGALYIMGSLILKIDGKIESLPTVFKLFDLEKHINKFNVNVAPIPPIVIKPAVKTASFVAILVADKPALQLQYLLQCQP